MKPMSLLVIVLMLVLSAGVGMVSAKPTTKAKTVQPVEFCCDPPPLCPGGPGCPVE